MSLLVAEAGGEGAVGDKMTCLWVRMCTGAVCNLRDNEGGTAVVKRGSSSPLAASCFFVSFRILPAVLGQDERELAAVGDDVCEIGDDVDGLLLQTFTLAAGGMALPGGRGHRAEGGGRRSKKMRLMWQEMEVETAAGSE